MSEPTGERLVKVETHVSTLREDVQGIKGNVKEINDKLDDLLALRYKGYGAFALASALTGTGILGAFWALIDWIKHG